MKKIVLILLWPAGLLAQTVPPVELQVKSALHAAPAELREGASVMGWSPQGAYIIIRKGTNDLICLADDPNVKGLNVSCYHKDLEPFMARGRQLKEEGKNFQQSFDIREAEAKSGKLQMPKGPSTLYVFTADEAQYNAQTAEVSDGYLRYVIYIPWATAESTGLPLKPDAAGMPWIMDPGTHRAHIMINPPMKKKE
jgi:hypothetical protein